MKQRRGLVYAKAPFVEKTNRGQPLSLFKLMDIHKEEVEDKQPEVQRWCFYGL